MPHSGHGTKYSRIASHLLGGELSSASVPAWMSLRVGRPENLSKCSCSKVQKERGHVVIGFTIVERGYVKAIELAKNCASSAARDEPAY